MKTIKILPRPDSNWEKDCIKFVSFSEEETSIFLDKKDISNLIKELKKIIKIKKK